MSVVDLVLGSLLFIVVMLVLISLILASISFILNVSKDIRRNMEDFGNDD